MESKKEADLCRIEWCDKPIVRVLGTVMTRDDNLGGWVPYLNGGQSKVGIHESMDGRRYRIYGCRVNDKKVTLDCFIQRHMVFHETIGTFHHWKIGDRKMGLTFYTPAEARSFNRGVRVALEQLARVAQAEYASSSASSTCSRSSDDHQSSCTSPASSTGSSSCCGATASSKRKPIQDGRKKLSTSSTSSSSSRHATRNRRSPGARPDRSRRVTLNSTSSSTSTQVHRPTNNHHNVIGPAVTAASNLSWLSSTTSQRFCDTPSSCDMGQTHFRRTLPQQQTYSTNVSFLNRPIAKDGSPYELSALASPSPYSASSTMCREQDSGSVAKTQTCLARNDEMLSEEHPTCETTSPSQTRPHHRESAHSRHRESRRMSQSLRNDDQHHISKSRSYRHTKTPHLDILERQRDLKPTEPNSYVLFSSSKPATALGSQRAPGRGLTPGSYAGDYKTSLGLSRIDGYQYHPLLSTICTERPYQHPGTLSIVASTTESSRFYNRDLFHSSNIDSFKDDAIMYEPRSSLISSPKKSPKTKDLAERSKCRHCHEMFNHERNRPGACRDAPDKCLQSIEKVTCLFCADSLFYHCCRDDEGDYDDEPCACSNVRGGGRTRFWRRWAALTTLSIFLPCLCLYPPLRACHSCGVACHCCGGKHQAPFPSNKSTDKQSKR